tara:strand:+ start:1101 stop:1271 length:171 start_codon:yes stop_codon:yes gene_type:complete
MSSKTKKIASTRKRICDLIDSYLSVARGIDDIQEEGDWDDFEDSLDEILETFTDKE